MNNYLVIETHSGTVATAVNIGLEIELKKYSGGFVVECCHLDGQLFSHHINDSDNAQAFLNWAIRFSEGNKFCTIKHGVFEDTTEQQIS